MDTERTDNSKTPGTQGVNCRRAASNAREKALTHDPYIPNRGRKAEKPRTGVLTGSSPPIVKLSQPRDLIMGKVFTIDT